MLETVPFEAAQVTLLLLVPVTEAVNCWVPPDPTVAEVGATKTAMPLPPVLAKPVMARKSAALISCPCCMTGSPSISSMVFKSAAWLPIPVCVMLPAWAVGAIWAFGTG